MPLEPATPDFSKYRWRPIERARLADNTVTVTWADGTSLDCYSLWLAENIVGLGLDPVTREGLLDPSRLPDADDLVGATVGPDGELRLRWKQSAGAECGDIAVHPGWLHHVADEGFHPDRYLPPARRWTAADGDEPVTIDGATALDDPAVLAAWLEAMFEFGLARLRNVPATEDFLETLVRRIGPIRGSNFGDIFSVKVDVEPNSTANTGLELGQHTDLPTRETPPGFQFLHCIENQVDAGWSRMTDGLVVVDELRTNYPDDYDALTTLQWVFVNRSTDADHRWTGPIIDHVDDGHALTLRAFYPVRGFPAMDHADVPRAYAALRRFAAVASDDRFRISYPFEVGDIVGFDNRRILHGRDSFTAEPGTRRHLRGCYLDRDDVASRLRLINRARSEL